MRRKSKYYSHKSLSKGRHDPMEIWMDKALKFEKFFGVVGISLEKILSWEDLLNWIIRVKVLGFNPKVKMKLLKSMRILRGPPLRDKLVAEDIQTIDWFQYKDRKPKTVFVKVKLEVHLDDPFLWYKETDLIFRSLMIYENLTKDLSQIIGVVMSSLLLTTNH